MLTKRLLLVEPVLLLLIIITRLLIIITIIIIRGRINKNIENQRNSFSKFEFYINFNDLINQKIQQQSVNKSIIMQQ